MSAARKSFSASHLRDQQLRIVTMVVAPYTSALAEPILKQGGVGHATSASDCESEEEAEEAIHASAPATAAQEYTHM